LGALAFTTPGAGVATALAASLNASGGVVSPTPTRAGDIMYFNGTNWVSLAGNNSGTSFLQETVAGVPSWATPPGGGNVSNVGTPTNGQLAQWTGSTTIQGLPYTAAGSCTLADGSGASLTFTGTACEYNRIGNMVFIHGKLTYPSTASGASTNITISGPGVNFLDSNGCSLVDSNVPTAARIFTVAASISFDIVTSAQALVLNSAMTTGAISFACMYPAS
jgi:hypothetical protein